MNQSLETVIELDDAAEFQDEDGQSKNLFSQDEDGQSKNLFELIRKVSHILYRKKWHEIGGLVKKLNNVIDEDLERELDALKNEENRDQITREHTEELRKKLIVSILNKSEEFLRNDLVGKLLTSAARCDREKLKSIIDAIKISNPNDYAKVVSETRDGDTALIFFFRHANVLHQDFYNCFELLVEAGVNLNRCDYQKRLPLDHLAFLYEKFDNKQVLERMARIMLEKGACCSKAFINKTTEKFLEQDLRVELKNDVNTSGDESKLFTWLIRGNKGSFRKFQNIRKCANFDDGEFTLLQLEVTVSKDAELVEFLLKNGANPNGVTERTASTPLELAAIKDNYAAFKKLLDNKNTRVTEEQYNSFIHKRSKPIKTKYFKCLLESNKLGVEYKSTAAKNTPLHYAIIFSYSKAIGCQLKRGACLMSKNHSGRLGLDLIDSTVLEEHFDSCLIPDQMNDLSHKDHKLQLNFECFVNKETSNELDLVYAIGKSTKLQQLLPHPLIHSFLFLKWHKIRYYFYLAMLFQIIFFGTLFGLFDYFDELSTFWFVILCLIFVVNFVVKTLVVFVRKKMFFRVTLHYLVEAVTVLTMFLVLIPIPDDCRSQFRAFIFIEMAICLLLTLGYHPKLSKWSIMLQTIFKNFSIMALFFFVPVLAFAMGFNIFFNLDKQQPLFQSLPKSIIKIFAMLTGEFDTNEVGFGLLGSYLLFILFVISMAMILMNFWTGVAVTDIENIQRNSEVNSFRNLILFLKFADSIYRTKGDNWFKIIYDWVGSPYLFEDLPPPVTKTDYSPISNEILGNEERIRKSKFKIDFYTNNKEHFTDKSFPDKLDRECFDKIKQHCSNSREITKDDLESLKKFCQLIKKIDQNQELFLEKISQTR